MFKKEYVVEYKAVGTCNYDSKCRIVARSDKQAIKLAKEHVAILNTPPCNGTTYSLLRVFREVYFEEND